MYNYPNAANGISKIYLAQIIGIIASVAVFVTGIAGLSATGSALSGNINGIYSSLGVVGLAGGLAVILGIVSFVLTFLGLNTAKRDHSAFGTAFYIVIVGIVCSILSGCLGGGLIKSILDIINSLVDLGVMFFVIQGVTALLPNSNLVDRGRSLIGIAGVAIVVEIIANILSGVFALGLLTTIISTICSFVFYVLYLLFLSEAKKEL